jgi:hypothetical protein
MLNRMMFVYFIQKKGFLDNNKNYLRDRLHRMREKAGHGKFHSFYRTFLLTLFHSGLGQQEAQRSPEVKELLGRIPYLNGGLFDVHALENNNKIEIPDEAFERVFDFFDQYEWHLDTRQGRADNEINPDVLGYIFEKYINQKQMGAYYTKEDITGYISRNTIIPFLFDKAKEHCATAFKPDGGIWRLLKENPDEYVYPAAKHGLTWDYNADKALDEPVALPASIEAGVGDIGKRGEWNKPASKTVGLPTETWREVVTRRERFAEITGKLKSGAITDINELTTMNLDIEAFASDVIRLAEGPDLVKAFWEALRGISVLDPTCGSGAFLFAALEVVKPLYDASLNAMRAVVGKEDSAGSDPQKKRYEWARKALSQIDEHPSEDYFIYKSIVIGNLYGVDIMEEAVEICKLRLFLKLVAQLDRYEQVEPLPDIDFNIRPGNTLVGFASMDEVKAVVAGEKGKVSKRLDFGGEYQQIEEQASEAARAYAMFRFMQTEQKMDAKEFADAKVVLRQKIDALKLRLDEFLSSTFGVLKTKPHELVAWRKSHQPLHWPAEFYALSAGGGFDVIIGNPPYVEYSRSKLGYQLASMATTACDNLWAFVVERSMALLRAGGRISLITPLSLVSQL